MSKPVKRERRRELVKKFVSNDSYKTEQDLTDAINKYLKKENKTTSKTSIHRDLGALGIEKNELGYYEFTEKTEQLKFRKRLEKSQDYILEEISDTNFNMKILKVEEGYAKTIAHEIEKAEEEVLTTFSNNNSVLVITTKDN